MNVAESGTYSHPLTSTSVTEAQTKAPKVGEVGHKKNSKCYIVLFLPSSGEQEGKLSLFVIGKLGPLFYEVSFQIFPNGDQACDLSLLKSRS